jgi:hypothetical protein
MIPKNAQNLTIRQGTATHNWCTLIKIRHHELIKTGQLATFYLTTLKNDVTTQLQHFIIISSEPTWIKRAEKRAK